MTPQFSSQTMMRALPYLVRRGCPHCGELTVAPEASEYLNDRRIRHLWSCDSCGNAFQTTIVLR